jgi:hypothetical protein
MPTDVPDILNYYPRDAFFHPGFASFAFLGARKIKQVSLLPPWRKPVESSFLARRVMDALSNVGI